MDNKPFCFKPNTFAYPLCVGGNKPPRETIGTCSECALYDDMDWDPEDDLIENAKPITEEE